MASLGQLNIDLTELELEKSIMRYVDELHLELPAIVRQTFRLIIRDVMSITAPESLSQGRKAVARDINRAIFLLDPTKCAADPRLALLILSRNYPALLAVLKNRKKGNWRRIQQVVPFDSRLHLQARDQRGRVQRPKGIATPDVSQHKRYVRATQGHVGYSRAGWAPSARAAAAAIPSWVARHARPPGKCIDLSHVPDKPTITAIHDGTQSRNLPLNKIEGVIARRAATMQRDVERILNGGASRYFP